jgi:hypothetical protein
MSVVVSLVQVVALAVLVVVEFAGYFFVLPFYLLAWTLEAVLLELPAHLTGILLPVPGA